MYFGNFENEDTAKSGCFVTSTLFLERWVQTSLYFDERGASFKNGWEPTA